MDDIPMMKEMTELEKKMAALEIDSEEKRQNENTATNSIGEDVTNSIGENAIGTKRRREESSIKHPLMCRECGKIFTDTSNCRRHEKSNVCKRAKPSYQVKTCIANNFSYLHEHMSHMYTEIAAREESLLGKDVFEKNKFFLIESSMNLMLRTLGSERLNLISSIKTIENQEMNKNGTLLDSERLNLIASVKTIENQEMNKNLTL